MVLTRRARFRDWGAWLSSRRRRPTQRTVGPSDSQGETPNSFSMSAIFGCVKPALRNSAKSSAMTCSHRRAASPAGGGPDDIPYPPANDCQDPNRTLDAELFQDPPIWCAARPAKCLTAAKAVQTFFGRGSLVGHPCRALDSKM